MDTTEVETPKSNIKTRFLIISDTHGMDLGPESKTLKRADVAIHWGDLTDESKMKEYRTSIQLLKNIDAPLKLVIAGNHDFTMDIPVFKRKIAEANPPLDSDLVRKEYGNYGESRQLFEDAKAAGIAFLDERSHSFILENLTLLTVYATPYTPSLGDWGFQYSPDRGYNYSIEKGVDVVITHGPPSGIMDYTYSRERAGSTDLFGAIARARPRIHCFGHIHEGWGAKLVTWRGRLSEVPSHFTDIEEKLKKVEHLRYERCCATSHCAGDPNPLESGAQTLLVNASIKGTEDYPIQPPWLIDIELPRVG